MIKVLSTPEQTDLFSPQKEIIYILTIENTIDGTKSQMRSVPSAIEKFKDKMIREELINTVSRMVNQRFNAYKHSAEAPQYKWVTVKSLQDKLTKLSMFANTFAVSAYIHKHMIHELDIVAPGKDSRFYFRYDKKLQALKGFVHQQILAHERVNSVAQFREKSTQS